MKLNKQERVELLRMAKSRLNRKVNRASREYSPGYSYDAFIAFLEDAQSLQTLKPRKPPAFVPYKFVPL